MSNVTEIRKKIVPILQEHGVTRASLFGSSARQELREESDVDILVELDEDKSLLDVVALKLDLENVLGRRVDLVEYDTIREPLKENILEEQVPVL